MLFHTLKEKDEMQQFLSSGVSSIDRLLEGGLELGSLSAIHSDADVGKSFFNFQLAIMANRPKEDGGLNSPSLIVDTEGFYSERVMNKYIGFFKKRWDMKDEDIHVDILQMRNIEGLYNYFGLRPNIEVVGSKMQASVEAINTPIKDGRKIIGHLDHIESSKVWKDINEIGYGYIGIDSITMPLKIRCPPSSLSWLAGRAALMSPFMGTLNDLSIRTNIVVFCVHHLVKADVKKQKSGWGHPWGGENIRYIQKRMLLLMKSTQSERDAFGVRSRRMHLYRLPGSEQKTIAVELAKDIGFVDVMPQGGRKTKG